VLGISASKEFGHYFTVIGFRPLLTVTDLEMPLMFVVLSVTVCNTTFSMSEQVLEYTQQADVQCLLLLQCHIRYFFKFQVLSFKFVHPRCVVDKF
jgi:NADH:ubiquinone oxidoreductase subunit H